LEELVNPEFQETYIRDMCKKLFNIEVYQKDIELITEGLMNYVFKVKTAKGDIFFKQSLKKAKFHDRLGADLASVSFKRIKYEKKVIANIQDKLPGSIKVPHIIHYDEKNNVVIMTDVAGKKGQLLQDCLLAGNFNKQVAAQIGRFLGIVHRYTYQKKVTVRGNREEDKKNWQVFLNMRTRGIQAGLIKSDIAKELATLYHGTLSNHTYDVLIIMDCCPKNIFQRADKSVGIFDFEFASGVGDPAYDIGFLMGHYLLFSLLKDSPPASIDAIAAALQSYFTEIQSIQMKPAFINRLTQYAGATLLYRVAGSSPADYIPQKRYQELIDKGSRLVVCRPTDSVEHALNHLNAILRSKGSTDYS